MSDHFSDERYESGGEYLLSKMSGKLLLKQMAVGGVRGDVMETFIRNVNGDVLV